MLKAFSLVEASKRLPYDITAFEVWSKWNELYIVLTEFSLVFNLAPAMRGCR